MTRRKTITAVVGLGAAGLIIAAVAAYYSRYESFQLPTSDMEPTIRKNGYFTVKTVTDPLRLELEHGDMVIFRSPDDQSTLHVKRVIGLPGDTVSIKDKKLVRNGNSVDEPYVLVGERPARPASHPMGQQDNLAPAVVPDAHLFLLGDNRDRSFDSRHWGPIPLISVVGIVTDVYNPE